MRAVQCLVLMLALIASCEQQSVLAVAKLEKATVFAQMSSNLPRKLLQGMMGIKFSSGSIPAAESSHIKQESVGGSSDTSDPRRHLVVFTLARTGSSTLAQRLQAHSQVCKYDYQASNLRTLKGKDYTENHYKALEAGKDATLPCDPFIEVMDEIFTCDKPGKPISGLHIYTRDWLRYTPECRARIQSIWDNMNPRPFFYAHVRPNVLAMKISGWRSRAVALSGVCGEDRYKAFHLELCEEGRTLKPVLEYEKLLELYNNGQKELRDALTIANNCSNGNYRISTFEEVLRGQSLPQIYLNDLQIEDEPLEIDADKWEERGCSLGDMIANYEQLQPKVASYEDKVLYNMFVSSPHPNCGAAGYSGFTGFVGSGSVRGKLASNVEDHYAIKD